MEAKRKIKLEVIVKGKTIFEAKGKCNALYFDENTKIYWEKQKPDFKEARITLGSYNQSLRDACHIIFLSTNARVKNSNSYEIKTIIGRRR